MQIQVSVTDCKSWLKYLDAYIGLMKSAPRLLTTRELNQVRRATILKRKLEKKLT